MFTCSLRKILRLVKHTLASVSGVRDQEMALLDEMLSACAREASNKSLELIFSSHLFYQNRQERFISSLAGTSVERTDTQLQFYTEQGQNHRVYQTTCDWW